ncbi:hypothetical protein MUK42_16961 [Musa troglodytarum]|uniref:Single-stranded DNA binding protein Ssb-like OB fold domain-containing protein n=1 Tax=Musa troglodytarum TaxID=320322 RepID=A0A9E7H365_9LILI|nr:hypothetical protein MUK42_16961 [Musa troglodytarum]
MLTTKAVNSKIGLQKEHPSRHQVLRMLLAEILVGDETGMIVFTARNEQFSGMGHFEKLEIRSRHH